jgi:hypothetical protein
MRQVNNPLYRKIKARLYLNAVLPAFEDFVAASPEAQSILKGKNFTLSFQTTSGLKSYLHFENQSCLVTKSRTRGSDIVLHFVTEEQINKEFENTGFRIPIPLRGASRIGDIKTFKALTKQLEGYLRPGKEALENTEFHKTHVGLQLAIALRAAVELVHHEPRSRAIMKNSPDGLAFFSIGREGYGAWVSCQDGRIKTGKGRPEIEPDVHVCFRDAKTALQAIGNRIDVFAAIGLQDITVEGLIPLADALGFIFERIPLYITP